MLTHVFVHEHDSWALLLPRLVQVNKTLIRLVRSLVESTKSFMRWMDGTCVETPEQAEAIVVALESLAVKGTNRG